MALANTESDPTTISDSEWQVRQDLADKWLMVMHNHGLMSAGRTVAEAFYLLYTLENACKVQLDVMAAGGEILTPGKDVLARLARNGRPPEDGPADHARW